MAKFLQRLAMAAVLIGGATAFAATTAQAARPERPASRTSRTRARSGFQLFAGASSGNLEVNRVYCGMQDNGQSCTDVTGSPVLGGGSWPRGTPDQYLFNTGIQIAGVAASGPWAGDTVGAWSISTSGPGFHMSGITGFYSSLIPDDVNNWPGGAYVRDPTLFHPVLIDPLSPLFPRKSASQQDSWMRYWDGDPGQTIGRRNTMGILVEQRTLAWNFPTGNEDIIYFLYRFINITASDPAVYDGLSAYGYSPTAIAEIAAIGADFQRRAEAAFNVEIPPGGFSFVNTYANYTADMDVGDAGNNYASAVLPFATALTYKSDFTEPGWTFPTNVFAPPIAPYPGFVGSKYLKSPLDPSTPDPTDEFGITIFTTYQNPSNPNSLFPDPSNIYQGYRYSKGDLGTQHGDRSACTYPAATHVCDATGQPDDQRQMQSSGPFTLAPGQSEVIVIAVVLAGPVARHAASGYDITSFVGNTNLVPGLPPDPDSLALGTHQPRLLDYALGWVSHADRNTDGTLTQDEVDVVPSSLLDKALVAQAVFDNRFLLPSSPDAPTFYLIPGDNQVTVVWEKSPTETTGDPFYQAAKDSLLPGNVINPLYDPNFREQDVEGYRVWRGRSPSDLEMVAQYDYESAITTLEDANGQFFNGDYINTDTSDAIPDGVYLCAPELGIVSSCPSFPHTINLVTQIPDYPGVVQIPAGGRVELATGVVLITNADTAVSGAAGGGFPELQDTGVPFVYIDNDVTNGFRYYYAVTAYDVNSVASGPTSLSSPQITQSVRPRATATNQIPAGAFTLALLDRDGNEIDVTADLPAIDRVAGIFAGPMPPTNLLEPIGIVFSDQLVKADQTVEVQIDSIVPNWYHEATYYLTVTTPGNPPGPVVAGPSGPLGQEDGDVVYSFAFPIAVGDTALARQQGFEGLPAAGQSEVRLTQSYVTYLSKDADWHGDVAGSFFGSLSPSVGTIGGSRWFDGANESAADPTLNLAHGSLAGVSAIYGPVRNRNANALIRRMAQTTYHVFRAADFKLYWGAAGAVDSVIDITHNVVLPFDPQYRASWGFLRDFSGNSLGSPSPGDGFYSYHDFLNGPCLVGAASVDIPACNANDFQQSAALLPVDTTLTGAAQGRGFGLYINGEPFLFVGPIPASGTVWTLRTYAGVVRRSAGGVYSFSGKPRPSAVIGLRARVATTTPASYPDTLRADLARVHTVPDPYYVTNSTEQTPFTKSLRFVNLPTRAVIRVYSVSGILVSIVTHDDPTGGGEASWNLRNRNNQFVASGVYFYHVETPSGATRVGRLTVVNFAQ